MSFFGGSKGPMFPKQQPQQQQPGNAVVVWLDPRTGTQMLRGPCQQCGLLYCAVAPKETFIKPSGFDAGSECGPEHLQSYMLCVTCYDTPMGVPSENQGHKRLPDEEYRRNASKE